MKKDKPIGSYSPLDIYQLCNTITEKYGTKWKPVRPLPFYCLKDRLQMAWDVLRYKADVIYW